MSLLVLSLLSLATAKTYFQNVSLTLLEPNPILMNRAIFLSESAIVETFGVNPTQIQTLGNEVVFTLVSQLDEGIKVQQALMNMIQQSLSSKIRARGKLIAGMIDEGVGNYLEIETAKENPSLISRIKARGVPLVELLKVLAQRAGGFSYINQSHCLSRKVDLDFSSQLSSGKTVKEFFQYLAWVGQIQLSTLGEHTFIFAGGNCSSNKENTDFLETGFEHFTWDLSEEPSFRVLQPYFFLSTMPLNQVQPR